MLVFMVTKQRQRYRGAIYHSIAADFVIVMDVEHSYLLGETNIHEVYGKRIQGLFYF